METDGWIAPRTADEAHEGYTAVGPTAQVLVREIARAMAFDREEYAERVDEDVVATARDALFASLLEVRVGSRETFDAWLEDNAYTRDEVHEVGSEHVDNVVWHVAPWASQVVAATFQDERDAAVATLRRVAFGRIYRDLFDDPGAESGAD